MLDYSEKYFEDRKFEDKHYWMVMQWIEMLSPKNVFDYGCGEGFYVHTFNYFGIDACGWDKMNEATKNPYGLSKEKIGSGQIPTKKFDMVTCIDVLEHIPKEELEETINKLVNMTDRFLLLSICDITLWDTYKDPTHITPRSRGFWEYQFINRGLKKIIIPDNWWFKDQLYLFVR